MKPKRKHIRTKCDFNSDCTSYCTMKPRKCELKSSKWNLKNEKNHITHSNTPINSCPDESRCSKLQGLISNAKIADKEIAQYKKDKYAYLDEHSDLNKAYNDSMKERECLNVLIANLRSQLLNQDKNIRESMQPMITESCKLEDKVARLQKIVDAFIRGDFDLDE